MKRTLRTRSPAEATPVAGGTVTVAIEADPGALLPYATTSAGSTDVQGFLYQQLAELGPDLETYEPRLAESWIWSDDHRCLEVRLRGGLRWDDGEPLTAEDVRFTFDVARDARVGWNGAAYKTRIDRCDVADARTVRFHFTEPYQDAFLDANAGFIVPRHRLRDVPRECWGEAAEARRPVGCGPFRLAGWEPGRQLVLARSPHACAPVPYLDRVVFDILPDPAARLAALCAGRADLLPQVPEQEAPRLRDAYAAGSSRVRIVSIRGRQYDFVCYSPRHPALGRRAVRAALTLAVDRSAIIASFCSGFAEPFESPIVPIVWAYDASMPLTPYDPRAARARLDADGWRAGADGVRVRDGVRLEFELATNAESARRASSARVLAEYWAVVGARVHVRLLDRAAMLAHLDGRRFEAALSGWRARLKPDLEPMWGSASVGSKTNRVDYSNPEVDALNARAVRSPDREEARRLFHAAQRLVARDHPYTWLYYLHDVVGVSERLRGAAFDARGVFLNAEAWWVTPETRAPSGRTGPRA